jgi:hypothetical protein
MATKLDNPREYQDIFHWAETQKDGSIPSFRSRKNDPYEVSLHRVHLSAVADAGLHSINLASETALSPKQCRVRMRLSPTYEEHV